MATSKTTPKKKLADAKSNVTWDLTELNVIQRTEGEGEPVDVANYDEDKQSVAFMSDDLRAQYSQAVYTFLSDEQIPFKAELTVSADADGVDKVAEENTTEFNAGIPEKEPRQTIYQGDKTPRYVAWLQKYKPNTFKQKFRVIGQGKVTKYRKVKNEQTGQEMSIPYEVDALLSHRKTHVTEKPETAAVINASEDES